VSGRSGRPTGSETSERAGLKQNIIHQIDELAKIFLYLAFFFWGGGLFDERPEAGVNQWAAVSGFTSVTTLAPVSAGDTE